MTYPEDFISELKRVFPQEKKLHQDLDSGQCAAVGIFLGKQTKMRFSTQEAIDLFAENRENEILLELRRMRRVEILYKKWGSLLSHHSSASF